MNAGARGCGSAPFGVLRRDEGLCSFVPLIRPVRSECEKS